MSSGGSSIDRPPGGWSHFLSRRRGNRLWDRVLRGTGIAGLLGLVLLAVAPEVAPLVGLALFTMWVSGPLSPFFPVGLEPVLMTVGRFYPPWLVAAVAVLAGAFVEFLGYHLYGFAVGLDAARPFRETRVVRWATALFRRRPFLATWFCAWSPVPFWVVRVLAPLSRYPVAKYLLANVLGRYPKLWLFAALGSWMKVDVSILVTVAAAALVLGFLPSAWRAWRGRRRSGSNGLQQGGAATLASTRRANAAPVAADSNGDAPVRILFVAGIGRSGSTLLGRTLGASRDHFPAGEVMRLFERGIHRNELCSCGEPAWSCPFWGRVIHRLRQRTGLDQEGAEEVQRLCGQVTEGLAAPAVFAAWQPRRLRKRLAALRGVAYHAYRAVEEVSGGCVVVDTSKNLAWARLLLGVEGVEMRIVHLVRDSRGVSYSFEKVRKRPGDRHGRDFMHRHSALVSALLWNMDNLLAEFLGNRAQAYQRVQYNELVHAPKRTIRRLLDGAARSDSGDPAPHVGDDWVDVSGQHILAGNPMRFQDGRVPLREDLEWVERMSPSKRRMVSLITAPLLRRYGYPVITRNGRRVRRAPAVLGSQ
jgi:uncharacterized membrane protein YdjX (TVP38/TMEM64 family)